MPTALALDAPLAIVDLETTGAQPAADRVTEIALLEARGLQLTGRWSTLVNPGTRIPAQIQALTGISQQMVERAPRFAEIAHELYGRLAGRVLVAHNARFDYGFLRREFARAGLSYQAKTLCTVRLARRLYPQATHHDLDSLIERHGLACSARHRAGGDAEALWQFLGAAAREHGEEVLAVAARQVAREPVLPAHLERAALDAVPDAPGVYLLYGEGAAPLYVGQSRAMRSRVLQHFCSGAPWAARVRRIEWQRTVGLLGAELLRAKLAPRKRRPLPPAAWPYRGPLGIVEADAEREAAEVHVVHRWCYLGAARSDAEIAELLESARPRFDYDHYRILARHLGRRGVRTVPLAA